MIRIIKILKYNILILVLSIMIGFIFIIMLGENINKKLLMYSEIEITRLVKKVINNSTNALLTENTELNDLFITTNNEKNEIVIIDFDSTNVNILLKKIADSITNDFYELERGNREIFHEDYDLFTKKDFNVDKKGIIFEVPLGAVTNNALLSNIGPKIPIKLSFAGEVQLHIETKVENYGLNNVIISVYIHIEVVGRVILPLTTEKIIIHNQIPITIKIIQGKVPEYFINGFNSTSNVFRST